MRRLRDLIVRLVPGLARAIGRNRFERYVASPVPPHVTAVTPRFDLNVTGFRFQRPLDRDGLLKCFDATDTRAWPMHRLLLSEHVAEPTRAFHRVVRPELTTVWLYVDDEKGQGVILAMP